MDREKEWKGAEAVFATQTQPSLQHNGCSLQEAIENIHAQIYTLYIVHIPSTPGSGRCQTSAYIQSWKLDRRKANETSTVKNGALLQPRTSQRGNLHHFTDWHKQPKFSQQYQFKLKCFCVTCHKNSSVRHANIILRGTDLQRIQPTEEKRSQHDFVVIFTKVVHLHVSWQFLLYSTCINTIFLSVKTRPVLTRTVCMVQIPSSLRLYYAWLCSCCALLTVQCTGWVHFRPKLKLSQSLSAEKCRK